MGELNAAKSKLTSEKKELEEKITSLEKQTRELQATNTSLQAEKAVLESSKGTVSQPDGPANAEVVSLLHQLVRELAEQKSFRLLCGQNETNCSPKKPTGLLPRLPLAVPQRRRQPGTLRRLL